MPQFCVYLRVSDKICGILPICTYLLLKVNEIFNIYITLKAPMQWIWLYTIIIFPKVLSFSQSFDVFFFMYSMYEWRELASLYNCFHFMCYVGMHVHICMCVLSITGKINYTFPETSKINYIEYFSDNIVLFHFIYWLLPIPGQIIGHLTVLCTPFILLAICSISFYQHVRVLLDISFGSGRKEKEINSAIREHMKCIIFWLWVKFCNKYFGIAQELYHIIFNITFYIKYLTSNIKQNIW